MRGSIYNPVMTTGKFKMAFVVDVLTVMNRARTRPGTEGHQGGKSRLPSNGQNWKNITSQVV